MTWHMGALCAFDTETTGIDVEQDRIVTACVAVIKPRPITPWDVKTENWIIDPGVDIPEQATAVHGITTVYAKEHGRPPAEALDVIAADLALALVHGTPVVGMNLAYDLTMLDRECRRHSVPTLGERLDGRVQPIIDVLVLDKAVDQYRKGGRKLVDLCQHYGVRVEGAHNAEVDALCAARVAWRIAERYPWIAETEPARLHSLQVTWRAEQQRSLAEHFRKTGKDASDVDGAWPYRPWVAPEVVAADV